MTPQVLRASIALLFASALAGAASADLAKLDPRARAALASLRARTAVTRMLENRMAVNQAGELDCFIRGPVSRAELEASGARVRSALPGLFTAFIPVEAVERVAGLPNVRTIRGAAPVEPELDASVPAIGVAALRGPGPGFTGASGAGVLIGNIDSGVDFDHGDFKDQNGKSRLVRIWDQTTSSGTHPASFAYGSEWTNVQIDGGLCDEKDLDSHGTHVMGIAGGDGSQTAGSTPAFTYAGVAPRADLVMVKTDFRDTDVLDGVQYCFDLAAARGENAVVNLSLGSQYGPHDGTSDFESGLGAMTGPGRIIVKSAGNDRASGRHAEVHAAGAGSSATMLVSGSAAGRTVQIDGYYEATETIYVKIVTPDGTNIGPYTRGQANAIYPSGQATPSGTVYIENGRMATATGYEVYIEINVATGENMNGTWTFTFIPVGAPGAANGEVDLWRFYNSPSVGGVWTAGLDNEELISEPGNAEELVTVGAWVNKRQWVDCNNTTVGYSPAPIIGDIAPFSSPGPTRDGRQKPDITAPGMGIASTTSFDVVPICSPSSNYLNDGLNHRVDQGTSMAAPHVAGAVALLLQNFGALTPSEVKLYLASHALRDGTGALPNKDWGWGKLFLDQSVGTTISLFQAEPVQGGIEVRWQFADPGQFMAVTLERGPSREGPWLAVGAERRAEGAATVLMDRGAMAGTTTFYRLVATRGDGTEVFFGPLEVSGEDHLQGFGLAAVRPNPTRDLIRVDFTVPREAVIRLSLLDLQGRVVATLARGRYRPGRYQMAWSGSAGGEVPPGLYFLRLQTPEGDRMRRVAIAR